MERQGAGESHTDTPQRGRRKGDGPPCPARYGRETAVPFQRGRHHLSHDCRAHGRSILRKMRQGRDRYHGGMCRSGVHRERQRHQASRMACRLWRGKQGGDHHPRLAGRRHADTERLVHYRRKDQAQAAAYRSHPALGNGNGGQGNRGRRAASGNEGLRHRHSRHTRLHHRNALQARLHGTLQEVACSHRKRTCPQFRRQDDAHRRCCHDGRMGKGAGAYRARGTVRRHLPQGDRGVHT